MPYKDGTQWRAVFKINGQRYQKLFDLKRDAEAWESSEKKRLKERARNGISLIAFSVKYLDYAQSRFVPKTYDEKRLLMDRIIEAWGADTPVADITVEMAEAYLGLQKQTRSANASNKDRKNLHAAWTKGVKAYGLRFNPFAITEKFPHDKSPQYTPPSEDVDKFLAAATEKERNFILCYLHTAARRSEIFRWKWADDIDLDRKRYRLGTRKTKDGGMSYEWFPMNDELREALLWQKAQNPFKTSPFVFVDDQPGPHYGKPYGARRRFMKGLCKRAGVKAFGFHALRRFVASTLADAGKSTNSIRRFLRHSRVNTTELYLQNINNDLQDLADCLKFSVP